LSKKEPLLVVVNISSTNSRRSVRRRKSISLVSLSSSEVQRATPDFVKDFEVTDFILAREGIIGSEEGSEKRDLRSPRLSFPLQLELTKWNVSDFWTGKRRRVWCNIVILSITWLLEPERGNVHFRKFSGTFEHPRYSDKQGATINLFKHFTYIQSNKTLVLADIQCEPVFQNSYQNFLRIF
jgi:hypothetical protein